MLPVDTETAQHRTHRLAAGHGRQDDPGTAELDQLRRGIRRLAVAYGTGSTLFGSENYYATLDLTHKGLCKELLMSNQSSDASASIPPDDPARNLSARVPVIVPTR